MQSPANSQDEQEEGCCSNLVGFHNNGIAGVPFVVLLVALCFKTCKQSQRFCAREPM